MSSDEKKEIKESVSSIDIHIGSSTKVIYSVFAKCLNNNNVCFKDRYEYLTFDFTNKIPPELLSELETIITEIERDKFASANAPTDRLSLAKAEEDGQMHMLDNGWLDDAGIFKDNNGGGGFPRIGYALAVLNRSKNREKLIKAIRRLLSHIRHINNAASGITENTANARIVVRIHFSTVGAIGSGAIHEFAGGLVRECAKEAGAEAKIVLCMLMKGNFAVQNVKKATLNELTTLMTLRAQATGSYVDTLTGKIIPVPFDVLYISSNINNEGNIESLDRLLCHEGRMLFFNDYTPGGSSLRERSCDLERLTYSKEGDPECCLSQGMAIISRDFSGRIIDYLMLSCKCSSCTELPGRIRFQLDY